MDNILEQKRDEKKVGSAGSPRESMLDVLARQGALKMLTEALDMEVTAYLERGAMRGPRRRPRGTATADAPDRLRSWRESDNPCSA